MIYPHDPLGPIGPEYPKGFRLWYFAIVMALVVGAIFMTGGK